MENFLTLKKLISKGKIDNFYVFTGQEREVMKKYIKNISKSYQKVESFASIKNQLSAKSLFATNNTFVIEGDKDLTSFSKEELISRISDNTLILIYTDIDMRKKLFKSSTIYEFTEISNAFQYVKDLLNCTTPIAKLVANRCQNNIGIIELECDKLLNLKECNYKFCTDLVKRTVSKLPEDEIWDFIKYLLMLDGEKTYESYEDLKTLKYNEIQLATIMYKKFREYVILKASPESRYNEIQLATELNYYTIKYGMPDVKKSKQSLEQLANKLLLIHDYEMGVKTGKVQLEIGFKKLLNNLLMTV